MASKGMDAKADRFDIALEALVRRLHARGRLRVWSLVVTVFGDAIVPHGGRAPLSLLQDLMARLGIEAGAVRTAMSRLAADGWVNRERVGRNSFFELAPGGRHAFDRATRRIYAAAPHSWNGGWTVAIAPPEARTAPDEELTDNGFIRLAPGIFLRPDVEDGPATPPSLKGMLVIHGASAEHPEALRALWPSEDAANAYHDLIGSWQPLSRLLKDHAVPSPVSAMAARTLLLHEWRRIVLRDPGLPLALLPPDWPGEEARSEVRLIYDALRTASETWLQRAGMPPLLDPSAFAGRFERARRGLPQQ